MRLNEWLDANGKKVNSGSTGNASTTSSGSFKNRLEKLFNYNAGHKSPGVDKVELKKLTDDTLEFAEHFGEDEDEDCLIIDTKIYIEPTTEAWHFESFTTINGKSEKADDISGEGWTELLKTLRAYITVPVTTTPEYKNLLTEWVDANGKKVSLSSSAPVTSATKTNKEKFTELLQYMVDHKLASVLTVDISRVDENGFTYRELRQPVGLEPKYELATIVNYGYGQNNSSWQVSVYKSGKNIDVITGEGWEDLLGALDIRYNIPDPGTPEYKSICESATSSIAEDFKLYENLWG